MTNEEQIKLALECGAMVLTHAGAVEVEFDSVGLAEYSKRLLAQQQEPALAKYNDCDGAEESDPVERLRFFCSLAMKGRDWIDVEQFFDAVIAKRTGLEERITALEMQVSPEMIDHYQALQEQLADMKALATDNKNWFDELKADYDKQQEQLAAAQLTIERMRPWLKLDAVKAKEIVMQALPSANIVEGDGTNPPDVAVLADTGIDSGLLSKKMQEQLAAAQQHPTSWTWECFGTEPGYEYEDDHWYSEWSYSKPIVSKDNERFIRNIMPLYYHPSTSALDSVREEARSEERERLTFVLEHDAFIVRRNADSGNKVYQLWTQDEDEEYSVLHGKDEFYPTTVEAVDAAIRMAKGECQHCTPERKCPDHGRSLIDYSGE